MLPYDVTWSFLTKSICMLIASYTVQPKEDCIKVVMASKDLNIDVDLKSGKKFCHYKISEGMQ